MQFLHTHPHTLTHRAVRTFVGQFVQAQVASARAQLTSYSELFSSTMLQALDTLERGEWVGVGGGGSGYPGARLVGVGGCVRARGCVCMCKGLCVCVYVQGCVCVFMRKRLCCVCLS